VWTLRGARVVRVGEMKTHDQEPKPAHIENSALVLIDHQPAITMITRDFQRLSGFVSRTSAPRTSRPSIFLRRIIGSMFIRVNSKCAHQVRPPLNGVKGIGRIPSEAVAVLE